MTDPAGEFLVDADPAGLTRVQVRLDGGSVWLNQRQLAALFGTSVQNVSQHLRAIYAEGEVQAEATFKKYLIVKTEGSRSVSRPVGHYALPAILALGYRVRSPVGVRFRQWATNVLSEYAAKGFAMDDQRLEATGRLECAVLPRHPEPPRLRGAGLRVRLRPARGGLTRDPG